jgi:predicted PurR-regulated permease PerM
LTDSQKSAAAWAALVAFCVLTLWLLGPVLAPFAIAAVLAYALTPLVDWLDASLRGALPRVLAVVLVELLVLVLLVGLVLLLVPILVKELPLMREQLPGFLEQLNAAIQPTLRKLGLHVSLICVNARRLQIESASLSAPPLATTPSIETLGRPVSRLRFW